MAGENGFKGLISPRGADALTLVQNQKIDAITLDINLHDIDGWRVLARLKDDVNSRHIPVYIITTEEERERGLRLGAIGALTKPLKSKEELKGVMRRIQGVVEPHTRTALVISKEESQRDQIIDLIGGEGIQIVSAVAGQDALTKLKDNDFGVAVLDM